MDPDKYPVLFVNKDECCGCSACAAICPKQTIRMEEDKEGFLYPVLDPSNCIQCHLCLKVCPFKEDHQ